MSAEPQPTANPPDADNAGSCPLLVVIVNYKTAALTVACLESLEPELCNLPGARVAVVENDSGDAETLDQAIRQRGWADWARLDIAERNGGFAYGNNRAIRPTLTSGDSAPPYVLLLNSDTEVRPGAVRRWSISWTQIRRSASPGAASRTRTVLPGRSLFGLSHRFPNLSGV